MTTRSNPYDVGLDRNPANYAPLTPIDFIAWSARVCPNRVAVIHGERRFSWAETYARSRRLASALVGVGITAGDTVAALLSNTPEHYEAHFGVPMTGAVLNALNTRLDARAIAFMLDHGEAKVLLVDREFSALATAALGLIERAPLVIGVDDPVYDGDGDLLGVEYEAFLSRGDPEYAWERPSDEWNAIALSYTSGTTGDPKGVVTHHRGAYLNAIGNVLAWNMQRYPVYLWTLPMFHCNGWCFPWSIAAQSGTNVCLRKVEPVAIFRLMKEHRVTHYCGAPVVHNTLVSAPA
jgi:fatty-acyl-CoA synthase